MCVAIQIFGAVKDQIAEADEAVDPRNPQRVRKRIAFFKDCSLTYIIYIYIYIYTSIAVDPDICRERDLQHKDE